MMYIWYTEGAAVCPKCEGTMWEIIEYETKTGFGGGFARWRCPKCEPVGAPGCDKTA